MTTFLLEIGTEELPADFAKLVITQLFEKVSSDFSQYRLKYGEIRCTSTPRRIVLTANNVSGSTEDFIEDRKGPPLSQAFKNGLPLPPAIGFAKSLGLRPDELETRKTSKGSFIFAKVIEKGRPVGELLAELIPKWITSIQGRRFMRWGKGELRFSRPIRWIVALLDEKVVPIKLLNTDPEIYSNKFTKGHRLYEKSLEITSANEYFSILENSGVIIDRERRKSLIDKLILQAGIKYKTYPSISEPLLNELTDLVESPSLIIGSFDDSFLSLPPEVLTTVMKVHQRYIPLYLSEELINDPLSLDSKSTLLPEFLCITNGLNESIDNIRKGNERVLRARLSDAKFFVDSDLSTSSLERRKLLDEVSFAIGLGTLLDRVNRIEWIVGKLSEQLIGPIVNIENTKRAAFLCKNDLVSQMVGEFPELEGIIGGKYLLKEGEPREVALAVLEHYSPRGSKDSLPISHSGSILALAERFELLLSIFSKGERPSGSSDPYALRRAGNGIMQILWFNNWKFNLNEFLLESINYWSNLFPDFDIITEELIKEFSEFFRQRIFSLLEEDGIDIDLIQSLVGENIPSRSLLIGPVDIRIRADLLSEMRKNGKLLPLQSVVIRASRLAQKSSLPLDILESSQHVKPELFEKESECKMLDVINSLEPIVKSSSDEKYSNLAKELEFASKVLEEFFDGDQSVMVMTDNIKVRSNRLNLLAIMRNQANVLADFSQILS